MKVSSKRKSCKRYKEEVFRLKDLSISFMVDEGTGENLMVATA
jgi:hypothetical protein